MIVISRSGDFQSPINKTGDFKSPLLEAQWQLRTALEVG
jgi:hypothetical protein